MIVKVDSTNFEQYRNFFAEAYKYLEEIEIAENRNIIANEDRSDEKTFTSIAQYFRYIEEFNSSARRDYFLLKLPLDEGMLNIDANTRLIDVPASFVKSAIVQKDKVAETIIFTINRFIDNVDLCNVERIYVQWTAPDGNGGIREWATPVDLIDRESIAEKIKFGWTIDEVVTLYPGKVSFAVTFFIPDENQVGKVLYRLNTLPVSFEVKPALQPEINANSVINRPSNALNAAIRNNRYPGVGVKAPLVPDFSDPGLDLPGEAMLIGAEPGTLTLKAQAVANDEGVIDYIWYFIPKDGGEYRYRCGQKIATENDDSENYSFIFKAKIETSDGMIDNTLSKADYDLLTTDSSNLFYLSDEENTYKLKDTSKDVEIFYNTIGTVGVAYEIADKVNPRDRLYVQNSNGNWELYTGAEDQKDLVTYEKYTTFTVSESGKVVGEYYVEADNTITPNTSPTQASTSCYLDGPEDIEILSDLEKNIFIESTYIYNRNDKLTQSDYDLIIDADKANKFSSATDEDGNIYYSPNSNGTSVQIKKSTLKLDLRPTENTSFIFDWYKSTVEDTLGTKLIGVTGDSTLISDIGWYQVKISAKKNREEKNKDSVICRALFNPVAPTLNIVEYDENDINNTSSEGVWYNIGEIDEYYQIDARKDSEVNLIVNGRILIDDVDEKNNKLYSDGIKYEWRIFDEDRGEYIVLNTSQHANLIPSAKNPEFQDASKNEFSSHPAKLVYKFNGTETKIACFAINTLHTRNTLNESVAVLFEIV